MAPLCAHERGTPERPRALRRLGATLFLAIALVGVGGVAAVSAVSPEVSGYLAATESNGATESQDATEFDGTGQGRAGHDCPERADGGVDESTSDEATGS